MTKKAIDQIEVLKQKEEAIKRQRKLLEAKEREKQKAKKENVMFRWGEVAAAALADGKLNPDEWAEWCRAYLKHERPRETALAGIELYGQTAASSTPTAATNEPVSPPDPASHTTSDSATSDADSIDEKDATRSGIGSLFGGKKK